MFIRIVGVSADTTGVAFVYIGGGLGDFPALESRDCVVITFAAVVVLGVVGPDFSSSSSWFSDCAKPNPAILL